MIFTWLKERRRRRILAEPFPAAWFEPLHQDFALYSRLSPPEQARLRDDVRVFVAEKNWEGCRGLTMTDEVRVTVAAQACLLLLAVDHDYFHHVQSILVYPSAFEVPAHDVLGANVVIEGTQGALGQAFYRGPVLLAWDDVLAGGRGLTDGRNTVLHEFAHQLDFLDGGLDGTPPLRSRAQARRWRQVMTAEYERLGRDLDRGRRTLLDEDAADNESEFFAVATEFFFGRPSDLKRDHPRLFELLRDYYHQDPTRWFTAKDPR